MVSGKQPESFSQIPMTVAAAAVWSEKPSSGRAAPARRESWRAIGASTKLRGSFAHIHRPALPNRIERGERQQHAPPCLRIGQRMLTAALQVVHPRPHLFGMALGTV